eukprot:TRINITY_DN45559_c0_g1_i1.p1 TRINITY_DN45559_c0_g1~~TRINITY_DN45559_c0_g1_i1.p1  ORF type:complete len:184 (-),score=41.71 TRINITY_DN45559_c0_g1_i1:349-900(-)
MQAVGEVPSSYMIQNLPSRWSTDAFRKVIDAGGWEGMYDFFYVPRRTADEKSQCFGYAFINISSPTNAQAFKAATEAGSLGFGSRVARVVPASIQGIEALRSFFKGKGVMSQTNKPMFVDTSSSQQPPPIHAEGTAVMMRTPTGSSLTVVDAAVDDTEGKTGRSSKRWCDMEEEDDFDTSWFA